MTVRNLEYLFKPAKWVTIRILRIFSEEGYLKRVVARYFKRFRGAES